MTPEDVARFLQERLTGARAEEEWQALVRGLWSELLDLRIDEIVRGLAFSPLGAAELRGARQSVAVAMAGVSEVVESARADDEPMGRFLSPELIDRWARLARKPDLVQEAWIREVFEQSAIEHLVSDTLFTVLQDFGRSVPIILDSLTPAALGRIAKLGRAGAGLIGGKLKEEFERRLEPEIRKFLERGTRRAVRGAADFAVEHIDDDFSLDSKERLLRFSLEQSLHFHVEKIDAELQTDIDALVQDIVVELLSSSDYMAHLTEVAARFGKRHPGKTVAAFFHERGLTLELEIPLVANAFPAWCALLKSDSAEAWLQAVSRDLVDAMK